MGLIIAALVTTEAVNDDVLADDPQNRRPWPRLITALAMTGSAAVGDAEVAVFIEDTKVASIINSRLGLAPNKDDFVAQAIPLPANALLRCLHVTVVGTNDGRCHIVTVP